MQLRLVLSAVLSLFATSCVTVDADRTDPAFVLGMMLTSRTPASETRLVKDANIMFSNVGAIFYPKPITRYLVSLLTYQEAKGAWPAAPEKQVIEGLICETFSEPPYLRLSITDEHGENYQIYLDKNLMVSVRARDEVAAKGYITLLRRR